MHLVRSPGPIDDDRRLAVLIGQGEKSLPDSMLEVQSTSLHTVPFRDTGKRHLRLQVDQKGPRCTDSSSGDFTHAKDLIAVKSGCISLINRRGPKESIRYHDLLLP
jgi:hypothetical protein